MHDTAERLARSLLFEGYALYPYTPGATKNATPTPFGIAYPPAYAAAQPAAFDRVRVEVVALAPDSAELEVAALFLQAAGPRHSAGERREELRATIGELLSDPVELGFARETAEGPVTGEPVESSGLVLSGTVALSAEPAGERAVRVRMEIVNTTPLPAGEAEAMGRGEALRRSLLSCHALLGLSEGRFASPLEDEGDLGAAVRGCENLNTWPVLAAPDDSAVLGAAYMLPDHPSVAPESRVNLFDNTEIEEALLLHVHALSDSERAEIAEGDPAVREMVERAEATTPKQILNLHGRLQMAGEEPVSAVPPRPDLAEGIEFPEWTEPFEAPATNPAEAGAAAPRRAPPPGPADTAGEEEIVVEGRAFRRGGRVVLRPGTEGDPYDRMMDGRAATIRRIYLDYDGKAYLGVTIDDDPMSEVLRDAGRYLFFFPDEVEEAVPR